MQKMTKWYIMVQNGRDYNTNSEPFDYTSVDKITISNFFLPASNPAG